MDYLDKNILEYERILKFRVHIGKIDDVSREETYDLYFNIEAKQVETDVIQINDEDVKNILGEYVYNITVGLSVNDYDIILNIDKFSIASKDKTDEDIINMVRSIVTLNESHIDNYFSLLDDLDTINSESIDNDEKSSRNLDFNVLQEESKRLTEEFKKIKFNIYKGDN